MNKTPHIAVLYHIFYEDSVGQVVTELEPLLAYDSVFLFNICSSSPDKLLITNTLKQRFPGCYILYTSNKGKDIGGKLALVQLLLQLQIEPTLLLLLHDKKSLQALKSSRWKQQLLKIIDPENITEVIKKFNDRQCGMVATAEYIRKEETDDGQLAGINGPILVRLLAEYNVEPGKYVFAAGTMFWARAKPFLDFFESHNPLEIRKELENGNVLDNFSGTITHSWERFFSWIVTSNGLTIKGI